jgi:phosphopantetheine adenylyltransferase
MSTDKPPTIDRQLAMHYIERAAIDLASDELAGNGHKKTVGYEVRKESMRRLVARIKSYLREL